MKVVKTELLLQLLLVATLPYRLSRHRHYCLCLTVMSAATDSWTSIIHALSTAARQLYPSPTREVWPQTCILKKNWTSTEFLKLTS